MRLRIPIPVSLSALLLAVRVASGQVLPADEFFHSGAQSYLTNNLAKAREEVDYGLKIYPDDIKLKKLDELLKQQSQQQQQSKDDQQKQEQKKDDQQKQKGKQDQKDQQKQEKQSQEQKDKQKQEQQSKASGEKQDEDKPPSQPMEAHAMTPQEAKQLLDAQKGEEQFLQFKPAERAERPARTLKDW